MGLIEKIITSAMSIAIVVCLVLLILWPIWLLWSWVMPQLWSNGPESIIAPGYWLFVGAYMVFRTLQGFSSSK